MRRFKLLKNLTVNVTYATVISEHQLIPLGVRARQTYPASRSHHYPTRALSLFPPRLPYELSSRLIERRVSILSRFTTHQCLDADWSDWRDRHTAKGREWSARIGLYTIPRSIWEMADSETGWEKGERWRCFALSLGWTELLGALCLTLFPSGQRTGQWTSYPL